MIWLFAAVKTLTAIFTLVGIVAAFAWVATR